MDNTPKVVDGHHYHRDDPDAHTAATVKLHRMWDPQMLDYSDVQSLSQVLAAKARHAPRRSGRR